MFGAWGFSSYGGFVAVLTVVLAFIGAYVWGLFMWRLMFRDIYARVRELQEKVEAAALPEQRDA